MGLTLVLDAMGVIFASADDVVELLQPFLLSCGGESNAERVSDLYVEASLGHLAPDDFWRAVGLHSELEDEYLSLHRLTSGLPEFFDACPKSVTSIWCLSNDVGRWSSKLRSQFNLDNYLTGAVISGDVGSRKPDRAIYQILLDRASVAAHNVVFVDDRPKNLAAARDLGLRTVQFGDSSPPTSASEFRVQSFGVLSELLKQIEC